MMAARCKQRSASSPLALAARSASWRGQRRRRRWRRPTRRCAPLWAPSGSCGTAPPGTASPTSCVLGSTVPTPSTRGTAPSLGAACTSRKTRATHCASRAAGPPAACCSPGSCPETLPVARKGCWSRPEWTPPARASTPPVTTPAGRGSSACSRTSKPCRCTWCRCLYLEIKLSVPQASAHPKRELWPMHIDFWRSDPVE
mmetsp:Transcript_20269/g.48030  ORF Transcript_20269/g.48030 Transcript_20269/m.48030 type:complete len:200 (-) Transcript_20269:96-695(-)